MGLWAGPEEKACPTRPMGSSPRPVSSDHWLFVGTQASKGGCCDGFGFVWHNLVLPLIVHLGAPIILNLLPSTLWFPRTTPSSIPELMPLLPVPCEPF